jgi:hypothetical protein
VPGDLPYGYRRVARLRNGPQMGFLTTTARIARMLADSGPSVNENNEPTAAPSRILGAVYYTVKFLFLSGRI